MMNRAKCGGCGENANDELPVDEIGTSIPLAWSAHTTPKYLSHRAHSNGPLIVLHRAASTMSQ